MNFSPPTRWEMKRILSKKIQFFFFFLNFTLLDGLTGVLTTKYKAINRLAIAIKHSSIETKLIRTIHFHYGTTLINIFFF